MYFAWNPFLNDALGEVLNMIWRTLPLEVILPGFLFPQNVPKSLFITLSPSYILSDSDEHSVLSVRLKVSNDNWIKWPSLEYIVYLHSRFGE